MSSATREQRVALDVPLYVHEGWAERFPFVVQGTTGRGEDGGHDLGLFRDTPSGVAQERWRTLRMLTGMPTAVHARQVHGARVLVHDPLPAGLLVADDADGHVTTTAGVLLTVSVADCVPIALVAERPRAVAVLHAGWRGTAAGVLEEGIAAFRRLGAPPGSVWVHLGPAICGACYEVGSEVHAALGLPRPDHNAPVDLRAVLAARALRAGVPATQLTRSAWCTRCDGAHFFSHRAGSSGRQLMVIGLRPGG